ncbi:MAG: hypothetical protein J1F35_05965 [Erysipelotrichales bacterium]|nr:hypothetical protein [Erysipelotrichales bacterium]
MEKTEFGEKWGYRKNVSMDIDKVKELYPDLEIDTELKGHKPIFFDTSEKINDYNKFRFGQYKGQLISECANYSYLKWYYHECAWESRPYIQEVLEEAGYQILSSFYYLDEDGEKECRRLTDNIYSPEEWENYLKKDREELETIKSLRKASSFEFIPESNLDDAGGYYDEESGTTYFFPEVKECYYSGYRYYIPVINGKGKRIKNKKIVVTEFETNPINRTVKIKSFKVA